VKENRRAATVLILFCLTVIFPIATESIVWGAIVLHSGPIDTDTTWSAVDIHLVTGTVTVQTGTTLTIEAGTVVKFDAYTGLTVNGTLHAVGTSGGRIVFTSYRDDSVGGDTNGDGASSGQPGDWYQIYFSSTSDSEASRLENAVIRYGGGGTGSIYEDGVSVPVHSCEIRDGLNTGVYLWNSSAAVTNSVISGHTADGVYIWGTGAWKYGNEQHGVWSVSILGRCNHFGEHGSG